MGWTWEGGDPCAYTRSSTGATESSKSTISTNERFIFWRLYVSLTNCKVESFVKL